MADFSLPGIPWNHSSNDFGSVWQWDTPHFQVTVTGDNRSCYWRIIDLTSGTDRIFADGQTASFEQAERLIRETVGKAYPPNLQYRKYAGPLATTFVISTGKEMDFETFNGRYVEVEAIVEGGGTHVFKGVGTVDHYDFVVRDAENLYRIRPTYIVHITDGRRHLKEKKNTGQTRTYQGRVEPGCTGRAGFMSGTVEHFDAPCPIHEETDYRSAVDPTKSHHRSWG